MKTALLALFLSSTAFAQTARYPSAIATNTNIPKATNRAQSQITASLNASATTFTVVSASKFTYPQLVTIDSEIISICGISSNTLTVGYSSCPNVDGRGFDGTVAASHASASIVSAFITAWNYNALAAEIKAIETTLGINLANIPTPTSPTPIASGGTNATTAAAARTNLAAAKTGVNSDITELTALTNPPQTRIQALAVDYDFTAQTPTAALVAAGANQAITLAICPRGVAGADTAHRLFLTSTTTVSITGVSTPTIQFSTAAADNGAGLIRLTIAGHGLATNTAVYFENGTSAGVGGGNGGGTFLVTSIDASNFDLQGSTYASSGYAPSGAAFVTPLSIFTTSGAHGLSAGQTINVTGLAGMTLPYGGAATTIYGKVYSVPSATTFTLKRIYLGGTFAGPSTLALAEAALITGGTCTSGAASGTVTVTPTNGYSSSAYTVTSATDGAQEAVNANPGAAVGLQPTPTWQDGVWLNGLSHASLIGAPEQSIVQVQASRDALNVISTSGTLGTQTVVSANVNCGGGATQNDTCRANYQTRTLPVTSAAGIVSGDMLYLQWNDAYLALGFSYRTHRQVVTVESVASNTITTSDQIVIPLNTGLANNVSKVSMLSDLHLKNIVLDGAAMSAVNASGIYLSYYKESSIEQVSVRNFISGPNFGSGIKTDVGYRNTHRDLGFKRADTLGSGGDWLPQSETLLIADGLNSIEGSFGIEPVYCTLCSISNVRSTRARGRGTKCQGCAWTTYTNFAITAPAATGFGVQGGSYRNTFSNGVITGARSSGIYDSGEGNIYNAYSNIQSCGNNLEFLYDGTIVYATTAGIGATITLVGHTVIASESGLRIIITGGTNFITGAYLVSSVNVGANTWTLSATVTTGAGAAMTGIAGGGDINLSGAFSFVENNNSFSNVSYCLQGFQDANATSSVRTAVMPRTIAYLSANFSLPNNVNTLIPLDAVDTNYNGLFSTTTGLAMVPPGADGTYNITCQILFPAFGGGGGGTAQAIVYKNGATTRILGRELIQVVANGPVVTATGALYLFEGDKIGCYGHQNSGGAVTIPGSASAYTFLSVTKAF